MQAFLIGILSAISLPLGALTARYWQPRARVIAFLMAFGAGALLAALSIDLVGEALHRGEYAPMAAGCILGGILFIILNQIVNYHGGFLRKSSTMINYLQYRRQLKFQGLLSKMKRLPIFMGLSKKEERNLVEKAITRFYPQGSILFRWGDPGDRIYIVEEGEVDLCDPTQDMRIIKTLKMGEAFGWMSLLTGSPHRTVAVIKADAQLWVWSRDDFNTCLQESPKLAIHLCEFLKNSEINRYLCEHQGMATDEAQAWSDTACQIIAHEGSMPQAKPIEKKEDQFKQILQHVKRLPIFQDLNDDDHALIANRVFLKKHDKGYTFFHQGEYADRLYFLKEGEVALIDPQNPSRTLVTVHPPEVFGAKSFLTGANHSVSAISQEPTEVWVLLRRDIVELLRQSAGLNKALQDYLTRDEMEYYLSDRQHLGNEKTEEWQKQAVHNLETGQFVPSAGEMAQAFKEHKGAPLAIWLGILLDAVPESLVIGSSMIHGSVSLSLLAGVFLSNYPEALSSSIGMQEQKISHTKIILLWSTIMLITGIGAVLGRSLFLQAPSVLFSFLQGIAAGSMLTMIAETMLPESYLKGGAIVGISTLLGFLAALFFKTLGS